MWKYLTKEMSNEFLYSLHLLDINNEKEYFRKLYSISNNIKDNYKVFKIKKRNGKYRKIYEPSDTLKHIQRVILENILNNKSISKYAKAYYKGISLKDNVDVHVGKKVVLKLDIKDFFLSIKFSKVYDYCFPIEYFPLSIGVLYRNKYGQEISEDKMIGSILNNNYYSRAYFRESLIDSELSYYYVSSLETTISLEEAYNKGIARVYHVIEMSEEEYNSYDKNNIPDMAVVSYPKFSYKVKGSSITKNGSKFSGKVLLADGRNLEIDEAILEGHVKIVYRCTLNVSLEEFLANKDNTEYVVYVENGEYNRNDNTCVLDNRNDYIYVPTISEKFNLDRGLRY